MYCSRMRIYSEYTNPENNNRKKQEGVNRMYVYIEIDYRSKNTANDR